MTDSATSPTRIAFLITDLDVGGAERALVEIVTRLDRATWSPIVGCLGPRGKLADTLEAAGVPVTVFGAKSIASLGVAFRVWRWLRRERPALLQTFLFHANVLGRVAGRWAGVPKIVAGIRVADRRGGWRHRLDRWTRGWADRHVCVSEAVADFTAETLRIPRDELVVIPNGVDFDRFANAEPANLGEFGLDSETPVLLFVGRLDPQKDPLGLLAAFELVRSEHPQAVLLLVGDGPLRAEIERTIDVDPALRDHVHLLGRRDDVPQLMRAATVLVLPSRWEGMPNVVLEAMAAGLPVIATDVEGVSELIRDGETGIVVRPESPTDLAAAIDGVLENRRQRERAARSAQHHVNKSFAVDAIALAYADVYAELLSRG